MRFPTVLLLLVSAIPMARAADLQAPSRRIVVRTEEVVVVRPVRRVATARFVCVRCSRLPFGGLREPYVAHVPFGGLREACPPAAVETTYESAVLRVKG